MRSSKTPSMGICICRWSTADIIMKAIGLIDVVIVV